MSWQSVSSPRKGDEVGWGGGVVCDLSLPMEKGWMVSGWLVGICVQGLTKDGMHIIIATVRINVGYFS